MDKKTWIKFFREYGDGSIITGIVYSMVAIGFLLIFIQGAFAQTTTTTASTNTQTPYTIPNIWSSPFLSQLQSYLLQIVSFIASYLPQVPFVSSLFLGAFIMWMIPFLFFRRLNGLLTSMIISLVLAFLVVGHL